MPPILLFSERIDKKYLDRQIVKDKGMPKNSTEIRYELENMVVGQQQAIDAVIPFIQMYGVQLNPEGRPAGIMLLLGPTGVGKTETCEALAKILHGNRKSMLKVECGEYQMDHEVAKLVGSPPGYLGHRETPPVFSQKALSKITSDNCNLQIVLFDEVEKAAPTLTRMMLGILDKGTLKLGDGESVNFENSLIFMTSNLGASAMAKSSTPDFGLEMFWSKDVTVGTKRLQSIGSTAVKKKFTPEFINRIDSVVTYKNLTREGCEKILVHILDAFQNTIKSRLGMSGFRITLTTSASSAILDEGVSLTYGARELKRVFQRVVAMPIAKMLEEGDIPPMSIVTVGHAKGEFKITVK